MKIRFFLLLFLFSIVMNGQSFSTLKIDLLTPGAKVLLNNSWIPGADLANKLTIISGTYKITATKPGYKPFETNITLTKDEFRIIRINLQSTTSSIGEQTNQEELPKVVETVVENKVEEITDDEEIFVVPEEMPSYPGGDTELMKFINSNLIYPEVARENNIQGRVILRFCVTRNGTIDKILVLKPVDPSLDKEAIRVAGLLKGWKPGKQGGKPVNVWYNIPVTFQLR